jgi:hypothetical protein
MVARQSDCGRSLSSLGKNATSSFGWRHACITTPGVEIFTARKRELHTYMLLNRAAPPFPPDAINYRDTGALIGVYAVCRSEMS